MIDKTSCLTQGLTSCQINNGFYGLPLFHSMPLFDDGGSDLSSDMAMCPLKARMVYRLMHECQQLSKTCKCISL